MLRRRAGSRAVLLDTDYLSVGQAGNQIGTAFWENILLVSRVVPSCCSADSSARETETALPMGSCGQS
jgi:hypothetical protein